MSAPVLVLRPQPAADRTAERLRHLDLLPIVYPLFATEPVAWAPPDPAGFDALLLTSAAAVRLGGAALVAYHHLPTYAVGDATARAAAHAGFADVRRGGGTVMATLPIVEACGHACVLHLAGAEVRQADPGSLRITRVTVYRTRPLGDAAGLQALLPTEGRVAALVYSPRAGSRLAALLAPDCRARIAVAAISDAALAACGEGWRGIAVADRPEEDALLARLQALV